jgi:hypothetical protein
VTAVIVVSAVSAVTANMTSFQTGDVDIKIKDVKITNEKEVTLDYIVNEAALIYKKMRAANYKITDYEAADEFTAKTRKEHSEFAQSYPIVLRYICQMQEFTRKSMTQYLKHIAQHPWKSHDEYLESQSDYVVMLYKSTHPRWHVKEIANLRKNILTLLKQEHESFTKVADKTQKQVEEEELAYRKKSRTELAEFYSKYSKDSFDMQIRTESDISIAPRVDIDAMCIVEDNAVSMADELLM